MRAGIKLTCVRVAEVRGKVPKGCEDGNLHFVHGGSVSGHGWLNASMAYLPGFWHINPIGILANSPAKHRVFDPTNIRLGRAERFASMLRARFSDLRQSRYHQTRDVRDLPSGAIAIVLQGKYPYIHGQSHFSMDEMISEVLLGAAGYPVVIKPHPLEPDLGMTAIARLKLAGYDFTVTDANIHDLLNSSRAVVSVNSSATFEGFMHGKPAILFGRSDFSSLATTIAKKGEFSSALAQALEKQWDYSKMLYWYFKSNTIELQSKRFLGQLAEQIIASGLDPTDFGLGIPAHRKEG